MTMKVWERFKGNDEEWDHFVIKNKGNYRQLYNWGLLQENKGWTVKRFICVENNKTLSSLQILQKKFFGFSFYYLPGGASGTQGGFEEIRGIREQLSENFPFYLRLDSNYENSDEVQRNFISDNWHRPIYNLNSAKTLYIKLNSKEKNFVGLNSKNWKKNIKKFKKNEVKIHVDRKITINQIKKASADMQKYKNVYLRDDPINISNIIEFFDEDILIVYCLDRQKRILGFRSALIRGNRAWEFYAATTEEGRKLSVGFGLLDELTKECARKGVELFILPLSKTNFGDTNFKKGSGGELHNLVGEWEYSNTIFARPLINFILYLLYSSTIVASLKKFFHLKLT